MTQKDCKHANFLGMFPQQNLGCLQINVITRIPPVNDSKVAIISGAAPFSTVHLQNQSLTGTNCNMHCPAVNCV